VVARATIIVRDLASYLSDLTWTLVALTGHVLAIDRFRATVRWAIRRWRRDGWL
jgi:hypothetical protein